MAEYPAERWDSVAWSMIVIASLLTLAAIFCGINVIILLCKNVQAKEFKIAGTISVLLFMFNSVSILINFVVIVYTEWNNSQLLAMLSIPWRFLYSVSLLTILLLFLLRLYFVFKGTQYAFPIKIFKLLCIGAGFALFCAFLSSILSLGEFSDIPVTNSLAVLGTLTYTICSIITVAMFIKCLFLVCVNYNSFACDRPKELYRNIKPS